MKPRIIFVGIHNKPGMEPLDSRTKSGKIIDEVIKGLEGWECVKSNLFNTDGIPEGWLKQFWTNDWMERIKPVPGDYFFLLGKIVHDNFPLCGRRCIEVEHPASRHIKREQYIKSLIEKILEHG
jgi:hypothetical protein